MEPLLARFWWRNASKRPQMARFSPSFSPMIPSIAGKIAQLLDLRPLARLRPVHAALRPLAEVHPLSLAHCLDLIGQHTRPLLAGPAPLSASPLLLKCRWLCPPCAILWKLCPPRALLWWVGWGHPTTPPVSLSQSRSGEGHMRPRSGEKDTVVPTTYGPAHPHQAPPLPPR